MKLEVELKFRADDPRELKDRLHAMGATAVGTENHVDTYFCAPHRDFAVTDEALRIRRTDALAWLTYKGPKIDAQSKTREECEAPLDANAADTIEAILGTLGFGKVREIRKRRELYFLKWRSWPTTISLDHVEGLPLHVELEIHAESDEMETARDALLMLAESLELSHSERRSYLEMLLERDRS